MSHMGLGLVTWSTWAWLEEDMRKGVGASERFTLSTVQNGEEHILRNFGKI